MSESKKKPLTKKKGKTLLLDVKTIEILIEYAQDKLGTNSMSAAVRLMAREYHDNKNKEQER